MGKRNRERRAAKQKNRRRSGSQPESDRLRSEQDRGELLQQLVIALSTGASHPVPAVPAHRLMAEFSAYERELDIAADLTVHEAIRAAWEHGWSPTDLHEIGRRRLDAGAVRYLDEAIVLESRRYSVATLHHRWRSELAGIATGTEPPHSPQMLRWAAAHSIDLQTALTIVIQVLQLLARIPAIQSLIPPPGSQIQHTVTVNDVDEKMLARVRALLAKAEATEYPDEAEALSAKAQALMARHSLGAAVADHDRGHVPVATARRLWIDNPYVAAKVALVQAVAQANQCRTVWIKDLGCVVTIGSDTDLDLVELLVTSLLVQENRAMLVAGRRHAVRGQSRTRSFRLSFLVAYATRIGERLTATSSSVSDEMQHDGRLLPVLAARNQASDDVFTRMFPRTVASPLAAYDTVGLSAGRAAAETATIDTRTSIAI